MRGLRRAIVGAVLLWTARWALLELAAAWDHLAKPPKPLNE
jgi:hypothetical protein